MKYGDIKTIQAAVSEAARYEQLAEECAELGHAALKMARILRGENPTPASRWDARKDVLEEYNDVCVNAMAVDILQDSDMMEAKIMRWLERLKDCQRI